MAPTFPKINNMPSPSISNRRQQRLSAYLSFPLFDNRHLMELLRAVTITIALATQIAPSHCFLFQSKRASTLSSPTINTCCDVTKSKTSEFCRAFNTLNFMDQHALRVMMGCDSAIEKRKPNFIRYGRSAQPAFSNARRLADPNFLRFGRSSTTDNTNSIFLPEKKSANGVSANFLRFGKAASDPNFLRFGKRASPSSSAILGAAAESSAPNFLRFGRSAPSIGSGDLMQERFSREYRKPNFLRFG